MRSLTNVSSWTKYPKNIYKQNENIRDQVHQNFRPKATPSSFSLHIFFFLFCPYTHSTTSCWPFSRFFSHSRSELCIYKPWALRTCGRLDRKFNQARKRGGKNKKRIFIRFRRWENSLYSSLFVSFWPSWLIVACYWNFLPLTTE